MFIPTAFQYIGEWKENKMVKLYPKQIWIYLEFLSGSM
jgi:hypothetical protein